jgi:hypothetical protein
MDYAKARKLLVEHLNIWKPEGEIAEVLDKCLQALNDCLEMGLNGKGD